VPKAAGCYIFNQACRRHEYECGVSRVKSGELVADMLVHDFQMPGLTRRPFSPYVCYNWLHVFFRPEKTEITIQITNIHHYLIVFYDLKHANMTLLTYYFHILID
jgi:hypothetical protein